MRLFPSVLPPGTVVAAGGPSVPIGRSGWKQIASTWNSDIGNGRFCGHPPFPVEGRGKELSILVLLVFPSGTDILFGGLPVPFPFSAPPPGTVVAVGGLPVPFGRSRWKHFAPTWNSDRRNGRFCGHPPFQVKGRGRNRLIIAFPAFHQARSSPLGDRRCRCSFLSFHRARSSPLEGCRCRLAVPGGSKMPPPGTPTSGMDVSVADFRSR